MWCDIGQDIYFYVIESEGEAGSVDKDCRFSVYVYIILSVLASSLY